LQFAPSAYRRHAALLREPHKRCARAHRDEVLAPQIQRVWQANMQVYGADKVWRQLAREGVSVARCTVERLMRKLGLRGVMRGKFVRTTVVDAKAACPLDRLNRQFRAQRPNQLWVSDFTYERPRVAIRQHSLHRTASRGGQRAVRRQQGRQLRHSVQNSHRTPIWSDPSYDWPRCLRVDLSIISVVPRAPSGSMHVT
jgi:hypothetical protein